MGAPWFSALGRPLEDDERGTLRAYLAGLGMPAPIGEVATWEEAGELCRRPSDHWWRAEEAERARLEQGTRLDPGDAEWLALNDALYKAAARAGAGNAQPALIYAAAGAASHAAYHARLAQAAGAPAAHPFHLKYALYCAGHWPLGVYDSQFRIF
jgi:hypothetical protein